MRSGLGIVQGTEVAPGSSPSPRRGDDQGRHRVPKGSPYPCHQCPTAPGSRRDRGSASPLASPSDAP